jgi:hypothetical protein
MKLLLSGYLSAVVMRVPREHPRAVRIIIFNGSHVQEHRLADRSSIFEAV